MKYISISIYLLRRDYYLIKNWSNENWRKQSCVVTQDSKSRRFGKNIHLSQFLTLNIFIKYYEKYEDAIRIFNEWIKLT